MAYTPIDYKDAPFLGELPLRKGGKVECDVSSFVPRGTKEILIYAFITVKSADRKKNRAVYQIYTEDDRGTRYTQLMNTAFPADDFVMNSANLWLPVFGKKEFHVSIPDSWITPTIEEDLPYRPRRFRNLDQVMKEYVTGNEDIYTGLFLLGYRT